MQNQPLAKYRIDLHAQLENIIAIVPDFQAKYNSVTQHFAN